MKAKIIYEATTSKYNLGNDNIPYDICTQKTIIENE